MCKLCNEGKPQDHTASLRGSRRDFLKGTATGLAAGAVGLFGSSAEAQGHNVNPPPQTGRPDRRYVIRNGYVMTMEPGTPGADSSFGEFIEGDVLVEGKRIEAIGKNLDAGNAAEIDARGKVVMMTPPMLRAGYKPEHAVSLVASATAMGILVPPAIFMIVLAQITDTSVVGIFLGGFIPAAVTAACLMSVIFIQAHRLGWPKDVRPTWPRFVQAGKASLVPLVVPIVIVLGFFFGVFTATEAGALVAAYAMDEARAATDQPLIVNQVEFHPFLHQQPLLSALRARGMILAAHTPFARGRVFSDPTVQAIAARHGRTCGQIVLRWLLQHPGVVVIPGSSNEQHVRENLGVFDFTLSNDEMDLLSGLGSPSGRVLDWREMVPRWD